MDAETRRNIDRLDRAIAMMQKDHLCPQGGCRFMESKGGKAATLANWLSTIMLAAFVAFEILEKLV